jgi:NADH-quinone oxidoreductase subunit J
VETVVYICLGLMLIFGVLAVMLRSMLKSAIALALASAMLAVIMYLLGSVWAAIFELSVCSGLVTVIFISAISLSNTDRKDLAKLYEDKKRMVLLPLALIAGGIVLVFIVTLPVFSLPAIAQVTESADTFREILWTHRQVDIWGQVLVIITGALTVVALFKERE